MNMRPPRAIIIGGGIAGPAVAIFLKRAGFDAHVFEARSPSANVGIGLQIGPNGMRVLSELELANEISRRGVVSQAIDFYSQTGRPLGSINRDMAKRFGAPAVNISRAAMNDMILSCARREGLDIAFGKRLARIEDRADQPIVAHFDDGTEIEGDFIVGADGVHSVVRSHVVPDGPTPFDTGLVGFGGLMARSLVDDALDKSGMAMTFGRSGSFGYAICGPHPDNGAMWWSTQPTHGVDAATFRAMDQAALKQHVKEFHAGWHDPIPRLLDSVGQIVVTATLDVATLPVWSRKRTILIGDAAHATSPHAGQGASLALEDAALLSRLLTSRGDLGVVFATFENQRRIRVKRLVALARRNGNQKKEFSKVGAWMRDQMLRVLLPVTARSRDWIYAYDARTA